MTRRSPFFATPGKAVDIRCVAIIQGMIDFEIAGVQNHADRCIDGDADTPNDTMAHADKFKLERAQFKSLTGIDLMQAT